ncbi:MAG: hypothetical protein LUP94_03445 [Candidatus Methanomethylicus sp.]|nr:hypothetical protein [Candidatus Methanomethylicus sp.]
MVGKKKPLLLIFPMDMAAHYLRCLELGKRIQDQFEIKVAASQKYRNYIADSGFEMFSAENFNSEEIRQAALDFDFSWISKKHIERVLYSQIKAIEEYKPELVLGDTSLPLKMAAERTSTKFVSLLNGYMTKYYRYTRKVSRKHPGYQYSKKIPSKVFDMLTHRIENASFRKIHEPFRAIRKELKLREQQFYLDEFEGDINLICDLPEIFPQIKMPSNYSFIGPLFYINGREEVELLEFITKFERRILITAGSTGDLEKLKFLADTPFRKYGMIVSGDSNSSLYGPNILSRPFINHLSILPKMDLMICHGGNGTIYQSLACGIPVLAFPMIFEQEWNADRIEELGLGAFMEEGIETQLFLSKIDEWMLKKDSPKLLKMQESIRSYLEKPIKIITD